MNRCAWLALTAVFFAGAAHAAATPIFTGDTNGCPALEMDFRPIDYRTASPAQRWIVEHYHFTQRVATLQGGESSYIGSDLWFTLRTFPNHPRALNAMAEWARRQKRPTPEHAVLSAECWFARAIDFRPDDGQVRILYGIQLLKDGRRDAAVEQLNKAIELIPDDGNAHYNLGLALFEVGNYEAARKHAERADALGFRLPGLRRKLEKVGKW